MKFFEFFEKSESTRKSIRSLIITGTEAPLRDVVARDYLRCHAPVNPPEHNLLQDGREIGYLLGEGSFSGPRFFDIWVPAKLKTAPSWKDLPEQIKRSEHSCLIRFEGESPTLPELHARSGGLITIVDCKFPKTSKERVRFVDFRLRSRGCVLTPEITRTISDRIKTSQDLESIALTLNLIYRVKKTVTSKDLDHLLGEKETTVSAHSLLTGNMPALSHEIETLEPLFLITAWSNILQRFYCWLSLETGKKQEENPPPVDSEDDEDDENPSSRVPKLNKYQLRDYKVASVQYSRPLIREVLEDLNAIYQDVRRGRSCACRERLRITVQKLALKT